MIDFILEISNVSQNNILPNPKEILYTSLPSIYLYLFKIKCPEHPIKSHITKKIFIQEIKTIQGTKLVGKVLV